MRRQRGSTVVDVMLLALIAVLAAVDVLYLKDVRDAYTRYQCYANQAALDHLMWQVNSEKHREIYEVAAAYVVRHDDTRPSQLVILYMATPIRTAQEVVTVDLTGKHGDIAALCPLHTAALKKPAIDYWYGFGRWHCLHNKRHSE